MREDRMLISINKIEGSIFLIRGQKVMLDRDLAELYGVETRVLNQAVRRNKERFPGDFMFLLTREEIMGISQFVTSSKVKFSKSVLVFTEQGVAMLSTVLRSSRAIQVNIEIMRAFVKLRCLLATHQDLARKIELMERNYDQKFRVVFDALRKLMAEPVQPEPAKRKIGFRTE